jgi:hypothetical protein
LGFAFGCPELEFPGGTRKFCPNSVSSVYALLLSPHTLGAWPTHGLGHKIKEEKRKRMRLSKKGRQLGTLRPRRSNKHLEEKEMEEIWNWTQSENHECHHKGQRLPIREKELNNLRKKYGKVSKYWIEHEQTR